MKSTESVSPNIFSVDQKYFWPFNENQHLDDLRRKISLRMQLEEENFCDVNVSRDTCIENVQTQEDKAPWNDYRDPRIGSASAVPMDEDQCLQARRILPLSSDHDSLRTAFESSRGVPRLRETVGFRVVKSPSPARDHLHEFGSDQTPISPSCSKYRFPRTSREHLFYKIVTPSDVGKLNRLVIPKQHAERYFPLDPSHRKRGLFLSIRDDVPRPSGKLWWFRYSYWSSSQSYVLTKGWIGFVKEKQLQAGDIISFEKDVHAHELYINCRRKPTRTSCMSSNLVTHHVSAPFSGSLQLLSDDQSDSSDPQLAQQPEQLITDPLNSSTSETRLFGVDLKLQPAPLPATFSTADCYTDFP